MTSSYRICCQEVIQTSTKFSLSLSHSEPWHGLESLYSFRSYHLDTNVSDDLYNGWRLLLADRRCLGFRNACSRNLPVLDAHRFRAVSVHAWESAMITIL
ncbi:hypothetical protein D5086_004151 [Populus alba]|uniref:Uncharacterized protein n=2 Tax=Populus TaxID=3689 RepID=A0ACC4CPY7_POPAL|nr:hypothetical protein NC653_005160 [Populus alba x Populus x berolinensis]